MAQETPPARGPIPSPAVIAASPFARCRGSPEPSAPELAGTSPRPLFESSAKAGLLRIAQG